MPAGTAPESSLAAFAPVHDRALEEIAGRTVLDLGTCFGFLPLRLADEGFDVVASDHTVGTMTLLSAIARHTSRRVRTVVCDARAVPAASGSVDTVTAVHLLEATHVSAGDTVLIHGASGAVGSLLVQLVRERGARVIGTSSERGAAIVERLR